METIASPNRKVCHLWTQALAFLVLALVVSGCAYMPPQKIPMDRRNYIEAVSMSWKEQLLFNLVKLRYGDTITFLELTSINTNYSMQSSGNIRFDRTWNNPFFHTLGVGGTVTYTDTPNIYYAPIRGEALSKTMVMPINLSKIIIGIQTGWLANYIFPCCVESINDLQNRSPGGSFPGNKGFFKLAQIFDDLILNGVIKITVEEPKEEKLTKIPTEYSVNFKDITEPKNKKAKKKKSKQGKEAMVTTDKKKEEKKEEKKDAVIALLMLDKKRSESKKWQESVNEFKRLLWGSPSPKKQESGKYEIYKIIDGNQGLPQKDADCNKIVIQTRSILAVLSLLSQFIDVPDADVPVNPNDQNRARSSLLFGKPLDGPSGRTMFKIKHSLERPKDAFVAMKHRDYWFYIDDRDYKSKSVFSSTEGILTMSEPGTKEGAPVLTLPVH